MSPPYSPPYGLTSTIVSLIARIGEAVWRLSAHEAAATSLRLRHINRIHEHQQEYCAALNRSTERSDSYRVHAANDPRRGPKGPVRGPVWGPVGIYTARAGHALHSANELIAHLKLRSKTGTLKRAMKALLDAGRIEYTLPNKPNSRLQKYRLTGKGNKET